jgi:hypothetical protein
MTQAVIMHIKSLTWTHFMLLEHCTFLREDGVRDRRGTATFSFFHFVLLRIKSFASCMPDKCYTSELHPLP